MNALVMIYYFEGEMGSAYSANQLCADCECALQIFSFFNFLFSNCVCLVTCGFFMLFYCLMLCSMFWFMILVHILTKPAEMGFLLRFLLDLRTNECIVVVLLLKWMGRWRMCSLHRAYQFCTNHECAL